MNANIFVDNSLPLSGQAPRTPTLDIHDQQNHDVDGDNGDEVDNDLYIIGAVCHKSDYFAQRNLLEPSGTF